MTDSCSVLVSGDGFSHADNGFGHAYAELRLKDVHVIACVLHVFGFALIVMWERLVLNHVLAYGVFHFRVKGHSAESWCMNGLDTTFGSHFIQHGLDL